MTDRSINRLFLNIQTQQLLSLSELTYGGQTIKDTKPNLDEIMGEDYYLFGLDFRV